MFVHTFCFRWSFDTFELPSYTDKTGEVDWTSFSYRLNDLHIPDRLVRGLRRPVWKLLVSCSFSIETVRQSAQLVTVSI